MEKKLIFKLFFIFFKLNVEEEQNNAPPRPFRDQLVLQRMLLERLD